jgi:Predicted phosphoesterases, related to the Icc protein
MTKTRLYFVTDIHGSDKLFLKFVNAAKIYNCQVVIIGGDIAGKGIIPIFKLGNHYETEFKGNRYKIENEKELNEIKKEIRFQGDYPLVVEKEEWNDLIKDESKINNIFNQLIGESIENWCKIAEERLKNSKIKVIINIGNDDPPIVEEVLKKSEFVVYPNEKIVWIDDNHEMLSLGYSNPNPWNLPGDLPEEILEEKINKLVDSTKEVRKSILNIHVPPFNTHLDIAPKLDKDLKPVLTPGGEPEMVHVGSIAVRNAIEKYQPLAGLHGHIHESKGYTKIKILIVLIQVVNIPLEY